MADSVNSQHLPSISETISRRRNAFRPRGQAARWRPGSQGTQLPSQPISRPTTKQPIASLSRSYSNRWVDQIRNDNNLPPVDLWRCAVSRGHCGAMLRPLLAKRWQQQQPL